MLVATTTWNKHMTGISKMFYKLHCFTRYCLLFRYRLKNFVFTSLIPNSMADLPATEAIYGNHDIQHLVH